MTVLTNIFGSYFENEIAQWLAGEDFILVLEDPEDWSKLVRKECAQVVWKWSLLEMKHLPWDRADGCRHKLAIRRREKDKGLEVRFLPAHPEDPWVSLTLTQIP